MIEIQPIQKAVNATVTVPGSKSYTNRALLVAALAEGRSRLTGALFSDDTHYMCEALRKLGVEIEADAEGCMFDVVGNGGKIPVDYAELYIGNCRHGPHARSSVTLRSVTANLSLTAMRRCVRVVPFPICLTRSSSLTLMSVQNSITTFCR